MELLSGDMLGLDVWTIVFIAFFFNICWAIACGITMRNKGYSSGVGFALGFFLGMIGMIICACQPNKNANHTSPNQIIIYGQPPYNQPPTYNQPPMNNPPQFNDQTQYYEQSQYYDQQQYYEKPQYYNQQQYYEEPQSYYQSPYEEQTENYEQQTVSFPTDQ